MHVRLRAVSRITALANGVERADLVSDTHLNGISFEMSNKHKWATITCRNHHVIASEARSAVPCSFCLAQHVRQEKQLRTAPSMVGFVIMDSHHPPRHRGEDRHPKTKKLLWRFRCHRGSPREWCRAASLIDLDEIDRVRRPECGRAVAGNATRRTVLNPPEATKGKLKHHSVRPKSGIHRTSMVERA